jgi:molecular chaperone HscB
MLKVIESAVPVSCWSCSVAHNHSTLFCPQCSKIQPPTGGDYYSVFSIDPKLNVDLAVLEQEFHRLSRKLHPDRFARGTQNERDWSLADTALLNDAYRTLKDPIRRTQYLLKLHGEEIGEEHAGKGRQDPSRAPADLLEEVFDLNMQLEELRMARASGEEEDDPAILQSLTDAKNKFDGLLANVDELLHAEWSAWDNGDQAARAEAQNKMVALLDRRRYLSNLVREVNETLGA